MFKAPDLDTEYASAGLGWERLARGGVDAHIISAGRGEMFTQPAVRELAEKLDEFLPVHIGCRDVGGAEDR